MSADRADRARVIDLVEQARLRAPRNIIDFIEAIEAGRYDEWLEAILAAGHDRKRTRRRTRGFPRTLRS